MRPTPQQVLAELEAELQSLREMSVSREDAATLQGEIRAVESAIKSVQTSISRGKGFGDGQAGSSDPLAVSTLALREAIEPVLAQYDADRHFAVSGNPWITNDLAPPAGTTVASGSYGVDDGMGRTVREIRKGNKSYVSLRVAEIILTNLNLDHYLSDGTVPVIPNPQWSSARWNAYMRACGVDDPSEVL